MNKFVSVLVLGSALALSACGGDSDSSGSYGSSEPIQFQGLSNCAISGNTITVNELGRGCLVKKSNINNGKKFSLSCRISGLPPRDVANFNIGYTNDGDGKEIKSDIESNPNGKYKYICKPINSQFPTSGLSG